MDLDYSPAETAFRDEVRAFVRQTLPADIAAKVASGVSLSKQDYQTWHAILNARGWLAATWPTEYGGTGWSAVERHIFSEECARADAPRLISFGLHMLGPVLIRYGTPEQKAYFLPRILDGTDWWCQGYSETEAGSDLVALKTRAIRDGDDYIVDGQKLWTTYAHHANWMFCLVRTATGEPPHQGISFLLIDMRSPGVEVRPILMLDGSHEVNEVFLTGVRVPAINLIGAENEGWPIAKYLLSHERTNIAGVGLAARELERYQELASYVSRDGIPLSRHPVFACRAAELETELEALRITNLRFLAQTRDGAADMVGSSLLKIKGTTLRQQIQDLTREAQGALARDSDPEDDDASIQGTARHAFASYLNQRKLSIYGGSNEIQRNIVARTLLRN